MDNSFKLNDATSSNNISPVSYEGGTEMHNDQLVAQFDEMTRSQMKEIEVIQIEDEIIVGRLESELRDRKRGFEFSRKKLREYRNDLANAIDLTKEYDQKKNELIEIYNQLKSHFNDALPVEVNSFENMSANHKKSISELKLTFQKITSRYVDVAALIEKLQCKASEVNNNIAKQIDQKNEESNKRREKLTKTSSKIEAIEKELNQPIINSNLKDLIEKKGTRIIELETESGMLQKQLNQEKDAVLQDNKKLIQEKSNGKKKIEQYKLTLLTLETEIANAEKNKSGLTENVEQLQVERETIFDQISKEQKFVELSNNSFTHRYADIDNELSKIKETKQSLTDNFAISEDSMQAEIKKLYNEIDQKKSLLQKLEYSQKNLSKLNEKKISTNVMYNNKFVELEEKLNKAKNDLKKHEEIMVNYNKKMNNIEMKIKELEQQKIEENNKLESFIKESDEISKAKMIKPIKLTEQIKLNAKNEVIIKKVQDLPKSTNISSPYTFKSDSDESGDEYKIEDVKPKNSNREDTPFPQKKSLVQSDGKEQSSNNTVATSSSELFDTLITFSSSQGQTVTKTDDSAGVFKFPQPFSQYKGRNYLNRKKF